MINRDIKDQIINKNVIGEKVELHIKLKQEYPNKKYNLYTVYKIVDNQEIPIYDETFTKDQIDALIKSSSYVM